MTTKTEKVLLEVDVPEGETVIEVVCESTEHGKWMRPFRVVPPARAVPDGLTQFLVETMQAFDEDDERFGDDKWGEKCRGFVRTLLSTPAEPARAAGDEVSVPRGLLRSIADLLDGEWTISSYADCNYCGQTLGKNHKCTLISIERDIGALLAAAPAEGK